MRVSLSRLLVTGRDYVVGRFGRLPVRVRLTLSFAGAMVVLFGGIALLLYANFEAGLNKSIDNSLDSRAAELQPFIAAKAGLNAPLVPYGPDIAQIADSRSGRVLVGRRLAIHLTPVQLRRRGHWDHRGYRLLVRPLQGRPRYVLVVGVSLSQRNGALNTDAELLFVGGPIALLIACAAGYVLAERVLAPVELMRRRAAGISGKRTGARLPVPDSGDELQALGQTLNEMLARLDAALGRERVLVALASHELRTPLSIIKLELELALDPERSRAEL